MRNIRQNLFFAFTNNAPSTPIAARVLYPFSEFCVVQMIADAAMSFSSVLVIGSALVQRLLDFHRRFLRRKCAVRNSVGDLPDNFLKTRLNCESD